MNLADLTSLVLKVSITLLVFCLGLDVTVHEVTHLWRRTGLLLRSMLAMNFIMPLVAATLAAAFDLQPVVKIALVALSLSPIPPILPKKVVEPGRDVSFTFGLLVAEGALAILFVPVGLDLFAMAFNVQGTLSLVEVALIVLSTVMLPLAAGMLVRRIAPHLALRIAAPLSRLAIALVLASLLPILIATSSAIVSLIGDGTLAAIVAFVVLGLVAGHLLGGPNPEYRTVLAISTSSRHPAVALAIAVTIIPEQKLVLAALLLYLIVNALITLPYIAWRRHSAVSNTVNPAAPSV